MIKHLLKGYLNAKLFGRNIQRRIAYNLGRKKQLSEAWNEQDPELKYRVARPIAVHPNVSWSTETILVLILGDDDGIFSFSQMLAANNASISFRFLEHFQEVYQIPLEQYTMVLMSTGAPEQGIYVADVGGILRRADPDLTLVWASSKFELSIASDTSKKKFCDIQLALPTSPEKLFAMTHPETG
jgi:hypothetical protein